MKYAELIFEASIFLKISKDVPVKIIVIFIENYEAGFVGLVTQAFGSCLRQRMH